MEEKQLLYAKVLKVNALDGKAAEFATGEGFQKEDLVILRLYDNLTMTIEQVAGDPVSYLMAAKDAKVEKVEA